MTCKDCIHYEACKDKFAGLCKICVDKPKKHLELNPNAEKVCDHFKDKSKFIELPCIAMVEQFIDGSLKFDRKRTAHNGRMAVIYIDKKKHSSFPLIDITDQFYNIDTAEARIKALERSK